ncbi:MAG: hypothetical protein U5O16_00395 [Rhodococcus sp. (in: high G+C Gram-positive bacteria)]|uniref:hypothetical protein n=1 Tax=Rhodococcus sp. TaxID=1831 RepID=UPI002AD6E6D4|nr:hypothetical protein [Rhodococcus sp. (in: high G+C Gram-positive bacteria)]
MDSPSGKRLIAVLAAVGASTGAAAAVVWHVAVADPQELGVTYARPSWFPVSLYLVAAGLAVGLVVATFLVDSGLRIVQDRQRSRVDLFALLIVVGVALGAGSALAWTHWPPQPTEAASNWCWENPLSIETCSPPAADFGWTSMGSSVSDTTSPIPTSSTPTSRTRRTSHELTKHRHSRPPSAIRGLCFRSAACLLQRWRHTLCR